MIHDIVVRYSGLFIVISCFYRNAEFFNKSNRISQCLIFIGKRSLDIYMLHNFLLPHLPFLKGFIEQSDLVIEFWILLVITIMVISLTVAIGSILRNSKIIGYYLLGAKK